MTHLKHPMTEEKVEGPLLGLDAFEVLIKTVLAHEEYVLNRLLIEEVQGELIGILALHTVFLAGAKVEHQDHAIDLTMKHFLALRTLIWNDIQAFQATQPQEPPQHVH